MPKSNIQNNVRMLRFHQNEMTQADLASLIGVSRQTVVAIEKGQYSPSLELAFKISEVFDKPIEEIFYIENKVKE
jgi:putative transcriptional regulator